MSSVWVEVGVVAAGVNVIVVRIYRRFDRMPLLTVCRPKKKWLVGQLRARRCTSEALPVPSCGGRRRHRRGFERRKSISFHGRTTDSFSGVI